MGDKNIRNRPLLACRGGVVDVETRPAGRTERRRAHALVPAFDHPGVRHVARTVDRNLDHHFAAAFAFVGRDGQVAGRPHRVGQRKGDRDAPLDLAILVLGILPGTAALADGALLGEPLFVSLAVGAHALLGRSCGIVERRGIGTAVVPELFVQRVFVRDLILDAPPVDRP